jgi:hypothetical protein
VERSFFFMPKVLGDLGDVVELQIRQGSTFGPHQAVLANPDGTPMNLTGCTIRAMLRRNPSASAVSFECEITDAAAGEWTFGLSAEQTATLEPPKYVYDVELEDASGRVLPLFHGEVIVELEVTHG